MVALMPDTPRANHCLSRVSTGEPERMRPGNTTHEQPASVSKARRLVKLWPNSPASRSSLYNPFCSCRGSERGRSNHLQSQIDGCSDGPLKRCDVHQAPSERPPPARGPHQSAVRICGPAAPDTWCERGRIRHGCWPSSLPSVPQFCRSSRLGRGGALAY